MAPRRNPLWSGITLSACVMALLVTLVAIQNLEIPNSKVSDPVVQTAAPSVTMRGASVLVNEAIQPRGRPASLKELRDDQLQLSRAPHRLQVGVFVNNNFELDVDIPAYSSNGRIWLKWDPALQQELSKRNQRIQDLLVLANRMDDQIRNGLQPATPEPLTLEDGSLLQQFGYKGTFKIDRLDLRTFPFNSLALPLIFEADDPSGNLNFQELRLLPDTEDSGLGQFKDISGWINEGWSIAEYRRRINSDFGQASDGRSVEHSQVVFESVYRTSTWASFWKLLQPVSVVLAMTILIPKIDRREWDLRAGAPITILLTMVFLHQGYKQSLPPLPYLTFLDRIYVFAYITALVSFLFSLWSCRREAALRELPEGPEREREDARLDRLDHIFPTALVLTGILVVALAWVLP